ncbi:NAD(P)-binding protein [Rhizobium sp. RU36D]|uniref:NAD(P)-binding protein n=1 Tax=Rhizobium sp. RU36D TaxID=1907415 RepID=UPI0009D8C767|nr:NAD(P)-binding protein [Rhizobium sp. RU36D]SMD15934.1 Choline dehydrogenase [Rhizobium sp. RU36D]
MTPKVAVIGSGLTGLACAQALIRRGFRPEVLDVGERLPEATLAVTRRLETVEPENWTGADRRLVTANDSLGKGKVPKKRVFGSDFYTAGSTDLLPLEVDSGLPSGSFAKGGYSVAWGGAVLPTHPDDLAGWPIKAADLEPSYRRVLALMPLSAREDDLAGAFPLLTENSRALEMPQQAAHLLKALRRVRSSPDAPFLAGASRLAVEAQGCRYCGFCLSGCVYQKIFSSAPQFDRLHAEGQLFYRTGVIVQRFEEVDGRVRLTVRNLSEGASRIEEYDRVFVAAGAIQSTRLVLESLGLYDTPVAVKDSQKYVLPLLQWRRTPLEWPRINALANLFVDFKAPRLSPHWYHAQISAISDLVLQGMGVDPWTPSMRKAVMRFGYERMMIAWGGLHSSQSSSLQLVLKASAGEGPSRLQISAVPNPAARRACLAVARHLSARLLRQGVLGLLPLTMVGDPGGGNHFGASLPMGGDNRRGLSTDVLGRLAGFGRVHVVDGAVLPAIPATTVALLQMANADRIATAAA